MPIDEVTKFDELAQTILEFQNVDFEKQVDSEKYNTFLYIFFMFLISERINKVSTLWEDFKNHLNKNRYFPDVTILNEIMNILKNNAYYLDPSQSIFRARSLSCHDLLDEYSRMDLFKGQVSDFQKLKKYTKAHEQKKFWGHDAKNSGAPEDKHTKGGRANPPGISYLYVTEERETAIIEVRPSLTSQISVAEFKPKKTLKLLDFTALQPIREAGKIEFDNVDIHAISGIYSEINMGNNNDYIPTQVLSEHIKNCGYDGLKFASSLHSGGVNIVLFDTESCKFITSEVYHIKNIQYNIKKSLPPSRENLQILKQTMDKATEANKVKN